MRVALFTESGMMMDLAGRPYPPTDQFAHFIAPLGDVVGELVMASQCSEPKEPTIPVVEYLPLGPHLGFEPLPFYRNTEDFYRRFISLTNRSARTIRGLVRRSDVVMLRLHHCLAGTIAREAKQAGKPLVLYWAGPPIAESARKNYPNRTLKHWLARMAAALRQRQYRRLARAAALHFFIDRKEFALMGKPTPVAWVVPNLVDEEIILPAPRKRLTGAPLRVVFAARLVRHKGLFELLAATARVAEAGIAINVAVLGDGPQLEEARRFVQEHRLETLVNFTGKLDRSAVRAELLAADAFVLPSYAEGVPKVLWEAWSAGLAVVMTPVGSIAEFVNHGTTGLLVRPGDVDGLQAALTRLAKDEDFRLRLAEAGLHQARLHSWRGEIDRIAEVLRPLRHVAIRA
jgi:glycosyltransferase involved in cell wall biosynthesis